MYRFPKIDKKFTKYITEQKEPTQKRVWIDEYLIYRTRFKFDNGYGASVIQGYGTYGHDEDLFEIAVLKDDRIDYSTHITDDVEGWLTDANVNEMLSEIAAL